MSLWLLCGAGEVDTVYPGAGAGAGAGAGEKVAMCGARVLARVGAGTS